MPRMLPDMRRAASAVLRAADPMQVVRASVTLEPTTVNREARTVQAVVATDTPLPDLDRSNYTEVMGVLLMSGFQRPKRQVPLCDTHSTWSVRDVLGSMRDMYVQGSKLVATAYFAADAESAAAFEKVADGHVTDYSVRANISKWMDIPAGKTKSVSGKSFTAPDTMPMRIYQKWAVSEVSVCAIGLDPDAVTRQAQEYAMNFEQWLVSRGFQPDELNDQQRESMLVTYEAERAGPPKPETKPAPEPKPAPAPQRADADPLILNLDEIRRAAAEAVQGELTQHRAAELQRVETIRALVQPTDPPAVREAVESAVSRGRTLDEARQDVLDAVRKARPNLGGPAIHDGSPELTRDLLTAGLCMRHGMAGDKLLKRFGEQTIETADRHGRHLHAMDLARQTLHMGGHAVPSHPDELIRAAFTISDLALILTDSAHLFVKQGFELAPETWRPWCKVVSASDFKTHTGIRLGTDSRLKKIEGAYGEVPHGRLVTEGEYFALSTYAEIIAITRKHVIDDSLGLLNEAGTLIGREAMETIADNVYTLLLTNTATLRDGVVLLHATHANVNSSQSLDDTGLSESKALFRQQTGINGRRNNVAPSIILLPDELERTALQLINSAQLITGESSTQGAMNVHYQSLQPVIESRLSDSTFNDNYSASSWYLSGAAAQGGVAVSFLNGQQSPSIERFAPGPEYVAGGVILQVYIDTGASPWDHRTIQRNDA